MMMRQWLMQLFGEASQWASLVDVSKLPAPCSSKLRNSAQTECKSGSQLTVDMLPKDLAIWLGKQAGVTLTRTVRVEECAKGGSTKMRPALAPYSDGDVLMGNIKDSVTNDLYQ